MAALALAAHTHSTATGSVPMAQPRILIIEDERGLTQSLVLVLQPRGLRDARGPRRPGGAPQGPDHAART